MFSAFRSTSLCFFLIFYCSSTSATSKTTEHWIVIHGTFARSTPFIKWWKPEGDGHLALRKALYKQKKNVITYAFAWSGHNNHGARTRAAQDLVKLISSCTKDSSHAVHIVAHSHGGTVALLAAQMLAEQKNSSRITQLFNLGTPVHALWYPRAFEKIDTVYHLFSYGDMVQPVITMFERILPAAKNVYNLQVKKDYGCPWHETMRSAELLSQLPTLSSLIKEPGDYCLHLDTKSKQEPFLTISLDTTRAKDLETDVAFTRQLLSLYSDSRKRTT